MISIIVPTYNEKENIKKLIDEVSEYLDEKIEYEIIVVDDDSPDLTWEIAEKIENKKVKVLRRMGKRGLASAVIDGFLKAKGDIFVVMDADFSHDFRIIPDLAGKIKEGNEIAVGSRFVKGGGVEGWPLYRIFISRGATLLANILLDIKVKDPMSGFFAIEREVFERIKDKLNPKGYKILLEILARSGSKKITEVPYVFKDRKYGKSKLSGKIINEYINMVLELKKK